MWITKVESENVREWNRDDERLGVYKHKTLWEERGWIYGFNLIGIREK